MSTGVVIVVLLAVLVLFGVGAVAVGWLPGLADVPADAADDGLPAGPLAAEDLEHARFGLAFRGYRMADVDVLVERLGHELAARDAEIAALRGTPTGIPAETDAATGTGLGTGTGTGTDAGELDPSDPAGERWRPTGYRAPVGAGGGMPVLPDVHAPAAQPEAVNLEKPPRAGGGADRDDGADVLEQ